MSMPTHVRRTPIRLGTAAAAVLEQESAVSLPTLQVGAADDRAELDADQRADAALRRLSTGSGSAPGPGAHRHSADCDHVRRTATGVGLAGGALDRGTTGRIESARGGGDRLEPDTRSRMEMAFGVDFGDVRVHADAAAGGLNNSLSARAFATGSDLFFGAGEYSPASAEGERVLAHELAHVVQNRLDVQRLALRRLMSKSAADVDAVRSGRGKLKGAVTKDTLYRLSQLLTGYHGAKEAKDKIVKVDAILGLCDTYLAKHGGAAEDADKVALVEDIRAEASKEHGQALAEAQYLADARGESSPATNLKHLKTQTADQVHGGAKAVAKKEPSEAYLGADTTTIALVSEYGLTEAEVQAIRAYTAKDYLYINPATANAKGWMEGQNLDDAEKNPAAPDKNDALAMAAAAAAKEASENKIKQLFEEGSLHAGVAMMGLDKLPKKIGPTYRGARMSQGEFDSRYKPGTPVVFGAFTSSAVRRGPALSFANGGGDYAPRDDQTLNVMCTLNTTNARDIRNLSIFGSVEEEWLLLPGATFNIDRIEEKPSGPAGTPKATKWIEVHLTQAK